MADSLNDLVHRADLDGLVRHVDATCAARDWDHLVRIRDAARAAVETGRQLWPIATLANFRLALWAPAELAVLALDDSARTFMPGPVSEILAVNHSWADLMPYLEHGHDRSLVAYERSLRGDLIDNREPPLLEIPYALASWEPHYQPAVYNDDGVVDPMPDLRFHWHSCTPRAADPLRDESIRAFADMMSHWTTRSNGTAKAVVVEGEIEESLSALGITEAQFSQLSPGEALAWLSWAASCGGAHGRRRGLASGRSQALWLLTVFTDNDRHWPESLDELGEELSELEFFAFRSPTHPDEAWWMNLVVVDPYEGLSLGLVARDWL